MLIKGGLSSKNVRPSQSMNFFTVLWIISLPSPSPFLLRPACLYSIYNKLCRCHTVWLAHQIVPNSPVWRHYPFYRIINRACCTVCRQRTLMTTSVISWQTETQKRGRGSDFYLFFCLLGVRLTSRSRLYSVCMHYRVSSVLKGELHRFRSNKFPLEI